MRIIKRKISLRDFKSFAEGILYGEFVKPDLYLNIDLFQTVDDMGIFTDLSFVPVGNPCGTLGANLFIDNITCYNGTTNPPPALGSIQVAPYGGLAPYTFLWSNGSTSDTIFNLTPSTYSVLVTDSRGCQVEVSGLVTSSTSADPNLAVTLTQDYDTITANVTTPVDSNTPNPIVLCAGSTATLEAGAGYDTYLWLDGSGNSIGDTQSITVDTAGTYQVIVQTEEGCTGESMEVTIEYIPQSPVPVIIPMNFIPNSGDGSFENPWSICPPASTTQNYPTFGVENDEYYDWFKWSGTYDPTGPTSTISETSQCLPSQPCEIYVDTSGVCVPGPYDDNQTSQSVWIVYEANINCALEGVESGGGPS